MNKIRKSKITKVLAIFLSILLITDFVFPAGAYALTSGPESPEFMVFSPVSSSDMVNISTGDFSYSIPVIEIPGTEGGGYALSLSYQSGNNLEQEASWVGFGWNLNPGAINRNTRGFPDDYDGEEVTYYNKTKPNWTISGIKNVGVEAFSKSLDWLKINASRSLRFNSQNGFFSSTGFGLSAKGLAGLNMNIDPNGVTFSGYLSPLAGIVASLNEKVRNAEGTRKTLLKIGGKEIIQIETGRGVLKERILSKVYSGVNTLASSAFGLYTYSQSVRATSFSKYYGYGFSCSISGQFNPLSTPVGVETGYLTSFNIQYPQYSQNTNAYGYMYEKGNSGNQVMDYYMEKGNSYSKRDVFLGMPFNNYDVFNVAGEGLSGGFRAYREQLRHNLPSKGEDNGESSLILAQLGIEVMYGTNSGIGLNIGGGRQKASLENWPTNIDEDGDNPIHFRFNNDLGGEVVYGTDGNADLDRADLILNGWVPGFRNINLAEASIFKERDGETIIERELNQDLYGSSSFIDHHTLSDISDASGSFSKRLNPSNYSAIGVQPEALTEYSIYTETGMNYVYGLPVFTRNETNLTVDVRNNIADPYDSDNHYVRNNYLVFRDVPLERNGNNYWVNSSALGGTNYKTIIGEIQNTPYAKSFLLSQITNSNYVDVNDNGPDNADFGGWTKFNYRQEYGGSGSWYRYRTPYGGLLYSQNSISDIDDDVGTMNTGEKEVYYLESIETNTHIAFFVTNEFEYNAVEYGGVDYNVGNGSYIESGSNADLRQDGLGSPVMTTGTTNEEGVGSSENAVKASDQRLQKLERIVLFSKKRPGKPIKTVYFEYDYSSSPNVPNNINSSYNYRRTGQKPGNTGKLTLKKIWFAYEGLHPLRISPYEFYYEYDNSEKLKSAELFETTTADQNPEYSPEYLDPWGNVMPFGKERKNKQIPWPYQGQNVTYGANLKNSWRSELTDEEEYDPAAWQLKKIKLPSGGEIHVQYEQKDYGYVQDQPAMAMASLIDSDESTDYNQPIYYVNVDDLGCDPTSEEQVEELAMKCREYFKGSPDGGSAPGEFSAKKMYFKFLYDLIGNSAALDNKNSEYITGYANVISIERDDDPLNSGYHCLKITLGSENAGSGERAVVPRQAAYEFLVNRRQGRVRGSALRTKGRVDYNRMFDENMLELANNHGAARQAFNIAVQTLSVISSFTLEPIATFINYLKFNTCEDISESLSFLKLPMYSSKKGGGIRVKRIMLYDEGLEGVDAVTYGQNYHYVMPDGKTSSGVATNEPPAMREENPLVGYIIREDQGLFSRLTAGEDKDQTEGPIGESILPPATVTYSRVVVENIHADKVKSGFTVHEFYTSKDYPSAYQYSCKTKKDEQGINEDACSEVQGSGVKMSELESYYDPLVIPAGIVNLTIKKTWASQGFRFIINSMNGLAKSITGYGGKYKTDLLSEDDLDLDDGYIVNRQEFEYYEPGQPVELMYWDDDASTYATRLGNPGKEMEIAVEGKTIKDNTLDVAIEFDLSFGMFPLVFLGFMPQIDIMQTSMSTHSTTKIINYPAILRKQKQFQDGMMTSTEYLAFDANNGNALITHSVDGFRDLDLSARTSVETGSIYNFDIPANWFYESMGQKAKDIDNTNQLSVNAGQITTYGVEPSPLWLNGGDINNVLFASAQTYSNTWTSSWSNTKINDQFQGTSDESDILNNIWRPKSSYVYNAVNTNTGDEIYNSGFYTISGGMFNWGAPESNTDWIKTNEVTLYSPHGNPLEEVNALNIPSAVLYGESYNSMLPVMVVSNASLDEIYFEDYERNINMVTCNTHSHSGDRSIYLHSGNTFFEFSGSRIYSTLHLEEKGAVLKFWLTSDLDDIIVPDQFEILVSDNPGTYARKVCQVGEWILYEAKIEPDVIPATSSEITIDLITPDGIGTMIIDDARFQPADASANCFVYDINTFKLLTQFDDQHFGLYYTYNQRGELTHKIKETERGMFTIEESHFLIPEKDPEE